jgi:hypothetical protein
VLGEVVSTALRASENGSLVLISLISGLIYLIISLSVSVMFFVFGFRVLKRIYNSSVSTNSFTHKSRGRLRATTAYIMAAGLLSLLWFVGLFVGFAPGLTSTPGGYMASWTLQYLSTYLGGLSHVIAVRFPRIDSSQGSTTKTSEPASL